MTGEEARNRAALASRLYDVPVEMVRYGLIKGAEGDDATELKFRHAVCPRYWGRWWRYRWIVNLGVFRSGVSEGRFVAEGYAWTRHGAASAAREWEREAQQHLEEAPT